jgi:hypothetical protein
MNTLKVIIPLVDIVKLVPGLPPGRVETVAKWEENAVLIYSSGDVNHGKAQPVPFEQWLAEQHKPAEAPVEETAAKPRKK